MTSQSRADNSPIVNIDQRSVDLTQFAMSYFIDSTGTMPLSQVQQQNFINSKNELTLGTNAKTTWSKIVIKNS
ncbi:MAG: 7TM-DISM domain-containing protein, partial [Pseudoalteromonas shioyasakiensis]